MPFFTSIVATVGWLFYLGMVMIALGNKGAEPGKTILAVNFAIGPLLAGVAVGTALIVLTLHGTYRGHAGVGAFLASMFLSAGSGVAVLIVLAVLNTVLGANIVTALLPPLLAFGFPVAAWTHFRG